MWNNALPFAFVSGNKEVVELLISKGANNFEEAITHACESGSKEIVDILISKKAYFSWNNCLNSSV